MIKNNPEGLGPLFLAKMTILGYNIYEIINRGRRGSASTTERELWPKKRSRILKPQKKSWKKW